jgi:hypothetical protein
VSRVLFALLGERDKMSAEETRSAVLKEFSSIAKKHNIELIKAQIKPKSDDVGQFLSSATGYWANAGDYSKPKRWLFHILPGPDGFAVSFPKEKSHRNLGPISTTSADQRKALLTFRLFPLVKTSENTFRPYSKWDWLLWIALKKILPPSLGNSAVVRNLDLLRSELEIGGRKFAVAQVGIASLCQPNDQLELVDTQAITYAEVTEKLIELVRTDSSPAAQSEEGNAGTKQ